MDKAIAVTIGAFFLDGSLGVFVGMGAAIGVYSGAHNWIGRLRKKLCQPKSMCRLPPPKTRPGTKPTLRTVRMRYLWLIVQLQVPKNYGGIIIKRRSFLDRLGRKPQGYKKFSFESTRHLWPSSTTRT
ncbi:MAG TPA: hypothetical protein VJ836_05335 [Candidatus Saccharimonadales bacterium]|nr:hypothetical protein [Candidatus Saccharimonadales bacterium]